MPEDAGSTPRDAATVILARPREDGSYEVLMTRRPQSMRFMGGSFVFPGGALDDEDCEAAIERLSALSPAEARERIGEDVAPELALGLYCCAVRELFEEVGVMLARDAHTGRVVDPATVRDDYAPRHREQARHANVFAKFCSDEGLVLSTDALVWHGRLITPAANPIRFDARFFVARMPEGQQILADASEVEEVAWIRPSEAILAADEKRMPVPVPTMAILQGLAAVPEFDRLMSGVRVTKQIVSGEVSELVFRVLAPNPGMMTGAGTNTWIVGRGETAIIDPAVTDAAYVEAVAQAAGNRGTPTVIVLTHMHHDHFGGAQVLSEQLKVPVVAWKDVVSAHEFVTGGMDDGDVLSVGGATLNALYTPGHASHHLCFLLAEEQSLFAGDVVAGEGTVVISPPDGSLADYMDTLRKLRALGVGRIYPGHGPVIEHGAAKLDEYLSHREERERQVIEAIQAGMDTIPEMVKRIYADYDEKLHKVAERSVLAHLEVLERNGRVKRDGESWSLPA